MSWSIVFNPFIPLPIFYAAAALAALIAIIVLLRRRSGAFMRALALAALVGAVSNPSLKQEEREQLSNIAVVVSDESTSQKLDNRDERTLALRDQLSAKLGALPNLEARYVSAGNDTPDSTNLFARLEDTLSSVPSDRLAGVIILSDGRIHDVPRASQALSGDVPVHLLLSGREGEFDRRIKVLKAPRYGIVGSEATVELAVIIEGKGKRADTARNEPARLRIRRQGKPDEQIYVRPGLKVRIPFPFPRAGKNIVEFDVEPLDDELTVSNNRTVIEAEGVRENLRVLLVSGEPHTGERTWRNLLKSDAAVDLVHFTILRPPEKQDGTPIHELSLIAFPTRELFSEKLHEFDLIIFDRYQRRGVLPILYLDNIARYVSENGGAVLVGAGTDYADHLSLYGTPLRQVLPAAPTGRIIEQPYKARISELGGRHPVTQALPGASGDTQEEPSWGRWFRLIDAEPGTGQVLMHGPDQRPLLVLDKVGQGRVALLLSDHAWLWARGLEGGGPHTPLLRRLAHWLMKEPDLEEEYLQAASKGLTLSIVRRTMGETVSPVTVNGPDGTEVKVTLEQTRPGLFKGSLEVALPGLYQLAADQLTAVVHAGTANSQEMSEVTATEEAMAPVMQSNGGGAFWTARRGSEAVTLPRVSVLQSARIMHGASWLGLRDRNAYVTRGVKQTPLYAGFAALAVLLVLLATMWWREGH